MSDLNYLIWFLATAVMTITVLTGSTLAAAGMLSERRRTGSHSHAHHQEHRAALPQRKESS